MNGCASLRKHNIARSAPWALIAVLLILTLCSASLLVSALTEYSTVQHRTRISLTEGGEESVVQVLRAPAAGRRSAGAVRYAPASRTPSARSAARREAPSNGEPTIFGAYDADTVWSTSTDVEIFRLEYDDNGDLVYTTASNRRGGSDDKVFAPGVDGAYDFTIYNGEKAALDYTMQVEAYITVDGEKLDDLIAAGAEIGGFSLGGRSVPSMPAEDFWLPIVARLYDSTKGSYIVGSDRVWDDSAADTDLTAWSHVLELDGVEKKAVLPVGGEDLYTLQWWWPFERMDETGSVDENDRYDTWLGDLAVEHDLTLHIVIRTWAVLDETSEPETSPRPSHMPRTGDDSPLLLWAVVLAASTAAAAGILVRKRREKKSGYAGRA